MEDYFLEDVLLLTGYNPPKKPRKNRFGGGNRWKHKPRKSTPWNDSELSDHEEEEIGDDELSDNRVLGDSQIRGKNLNRMPLLVEVFASQASIQRRGRAGRVREGKCYKLISKHTHANLHEHTAPEITRCALDQTLLSLLSLGVETGNGDFLQTLLDPPAKTLVDAASLSLSKIGAIESVQPDRIRLTALGIHLACIPAPPLVGKSKSLRMAVLF